MEEEEKGEKKEDKKASLSISWNSLTPKAQAFIKTAAKKYIESGMKNAEAVAKAHSEFTAQEIDMNKKASEKPAESVEGSTLPEGKKEMGDKPEESVQGTTVPGGAKPSSAPETSAQGDKEHKTPDLTKKPDEAVDGTTLPPQGKKDEESVEKTTHPDGKKSVGTEPEKSVQASKSEGSKPEEAVKDKPALSKKTVGDKAEQSSQGDTEPKGTDPKKAIDEAVKKEAAEKAPCKGCGKVLNYGEPELGGDTCAECMKKHLQKNDPTKKDAATEMPLPEDKDPMSSVKDEAPLEEKPLDLSLDGPKVDEPKAEVSAFDTAENVEIGEGYTANKDKETKEIIVMKDGQEVKRLPDGFGKDLSVVLPLMKAVLGLPPVDEVKPELPGTVPPVEEHKEEPKLEEHPAVEEAHEDELGIKESALKVKEAALAEKEAKIAAKEAEIAASEKAKKFASVLQARAERCKKIVATLVEKDALQMDKEVYQSELKLGTYLLDAQKKAFEHSIKAKQAELLAMDDNALLATEKVVADLKAPSAVNTKRANHIFVSPSFGEELSEDAQLKKIFDTFGTKNRPQ
jgi:hypothetical protein